MVSVHIFSKNMLNVQKCGEKYIAWTHIIVIKKKKGELYN